MENSVSDWPKELETGIKILDDQHKYYYGLVKKYIEKASVMSRKPEDVLESAEKLNSLLQYAKEHFSTEEVIMKRLQYPDYQAHHEEHVFFMEQVQGLLQRTKHGSFHSTLVREVNFYLVEWFSEHIRHIDMKLVRFLNEKSAEDKACLHFLDYIPTSLREK